MAADVVDKRELALSASDVIVELQQRFRIAEIRIEQVYFHDNKRRERRRGHGRVAMGDRKWRRWWRLS